MPIRKFLPCHRLDKGTELSQWEVEYPPSKVLACNSSLCHWPYHARECDDNCHCNTNRNCLSRSTLSYAAKLELGTCRGSNPFGSLCQSIGYRRVFDY